MTDPTPTPAARPIWSWSGRGGFAAGMPAPTPEKRYDTSTFTDLLCLDIAIKALRNEADTYRSFDRDDEIVTQYLAAAKHLQAMADRIRSIEGIA